MSEITLRNHGLCHIRDLKVHPDVLTARFDRRSATTRCTGRCCAKGVWVDPIQRDAILRHAAAIQAQMDGSQQRDPARWFDTEPCTDSDFPSGRAFGTATTNEACAFLRGDHRCVLQLASDAQTGPLKPFFCHAFPLTIVQGTLCLDDPRDTACCTPSASGSATVFDVCAEELQHVLTARGVDELRNRVKGETT